MDSAVSEYDGGQHDLKLPLGLDAIVLKRNRFAHAEHATYRVYTNESEFSLVMANSAIEAIEKSGVTKPYKVQREMLDNYSGLTEEDMTATDESVEMLVDTEANNAIKVDEEYLQRLTEDMKPEPFSHMDWDQIYPSQAAPQQQANEAETPEPPAQEAQAPDAAAAPPDQVEPEAPIASEAPEATPEQAQATEAVSQVAEEPQAIEQDAPAIPQEPVAAEAQEAAPVAATEEALDEGDIEALLRTD